jgi:WD40 repeat protein
MGLTFGPDSRSLIAAGHEGTAVPWDLSDPAGPVRRDPLPLHSGAVEAMTLSRDGRTLAVTGFDDVVTLLDMTRPAEPEPLATINEDGGLVRAVTLSPDAGTVAVGHRDGRTTLWDLTDRRKPALLADLPLRKNLSAIAFTPDGQIMAVGEGYHVSFFDVSNRSAPERLTSIPLADLNGYTAASLAFSPDGRTLAASSYENATAVLLDVADPARPSRIASLIGHSSPVQFAAFSPDGRTLATASLDNAVMLWDIAEPTAPLRFATIKSPGLQSFHAAFSPDGRLLAAGGNYEGTNENVTLWDTTVPSDLAADPAGHACAIAGRGLTADEWARYIPELTYQPTC